MRMAHRFYLDRAKYKPCWLILDYGPTHWRHSCACPLIEPWQGMTRTTNIAQSIFVTVLLLHISEAISIPVKCPVPDFLYFPRFLLLLTHRRARNSDLQIGLRVQDWVRVRFFNSSSQALCADQFETSTSPPGHTPGIWLCFVPGEGGIWTLRWSGGEVWTRFFSWSDVIHPWFFFGFCRAWRIYKIEFTFVGE